MSLALIQATAAAPDNPERLLLGPLDLSFSEGTVTLLIGRTGSGKSTLLQLLAGVRAPAGGEVHADGASIWRKWRADRRLVLPLGLTFQFPEQQLFARTIRHEFGYSLRPFRLSPAEEEQRTRDARAVWDRRDAFAPERSPFTLSGGQRRRLALATTAATAPDWLLMDEPTAGLEAASVLVLQAYIRQRRENGGGTVIATHDLDTFLPLADRVLVLQDGLIAADLPPRELCAQSWLLRQTGVGVPSCVTVSEALSAHGLELQPDRLTPEETAEAIAAALSLGGEPEIKRRDAAESDGTSPEAEKLPTSAADTAGGLPTEARHPIAPQGEPLPSAASGASYAAEAPSASVPSAPDAGWVQRLDPRAKWLLYALSVIGTMQQQSWLGLTVSLVPVLLGLLSLPRERVKGLLKFAKPLALFFLLSVGLSGLTLTAGEGLPLFGFSAERAAITAFYVYRLLIVTLASLWFAGSTSYGRMVEGLNWALSYVKRTGLPVGSFALAVALLFRFIPMILSELERFSLIVRARGKASMRPGAVRARDIPALIVPLMLSLFQRAEDMTMAMEMKGTGTSPLQSARPSLLTWTRTDSLFTAAGLLALILLLSIR
ncbi:ATP-binding cassette domain-containing protein [Paenibacillus puerhi]|uniref:ATP-binding cassette domain-containing protein n=1 Tax=Paenibacillus puerhi TaxID=2692622 RepID=UPI001357844B|nr:ATP-binding cassette domain-containing protein [Paenibacillus puerhi]